ncbi:MAG: hypothetical protein JXB88_21655 [Spirochaetales bacterium]|nr:hypothetical protein [Spirochaetales bacterium]
MVPKISTNLTLSDYLGSAMARSSINRKHYHIRPGLYATGNPDKNSFVFVTANYKLTFDHLRKNMKGIDGWILVLDTEGINVWCAAGKGTFGTEELVKQVEQTGIKEIVSHRKLILPQLGAPGVAAHEVKKKTGFTVIYGPVRAADIPLFLTNELQSSGKMREVSFHVLDRLILTPIELAGTLKYCVLLFIFFIIYSWILAGNASFSQVLAKAFHSFLPFLGAVLTGTVIVPVILPFIPGKAFALKGWIGGIIWAAIYLFVIRNTFAWIVIVPYGLLLPALSAFLAMNFTGATSYTSLSGVLHEMKYALPFILVSAGAGISFFIVIAVIQNLV